MISHILHTKDHHAYMKMQIAQVLGFNTPTK